MVNMERVYVPGKCNIGKAETRLRWTLGWVGAAATVVLGAFLLVGGAPPLWRLTLFLTTALGAAGFFQATMHFCANFGLKGVFNFQDAVGTTQSVDEIEALKKDRAKALQIIFLTVLTAGVLTLVSFFLP
ncbi:MAG: hypothetical protein HKM06_09675 [Spirochaetales bacterium]|nr:hypothetical protein [Spirochaetales bacterium]